MRAAFARFLRGLHRVGELGRSRLRLLGLRARYPGLHTEGRVFIGPGCEIRLARGSTVWLRNISLSRNVSLITGVGASIDLAAFLVGRGSVVVAQRSIVMEPGSGLGDLCMIRDADHDGVAPLEDSVFVATPVHIGEGAWIASGVMVLAGVTIGARAIVGAGAVVTRDVPADTTVVGIPARPIDGGEITLRRSDRGG
jgi:acetyltransferase-like isoleucine patch superfamily enzyme